MFPGASPEIGTAGWGCIWQPGRWSFHVAGLGTQSEVEDEAVRCRTARTNEADAKKPRSKAPALQRMGKVLLVRKHVVSLTPSGPLLQVTASLVNRQQGVATVVYFETSVGKLK
jgi:hypothetical protein